MSDLHSVCVVEIGGCLLRGRTTDMVFVWGRVQSYLSHMRLLDFQLWHSAIIIPSERSNNCEFDESDSLQRTL